MSAIEHTDHNEHTEQPLGKYVFALVMGIAYALAAVAIVYPFYMYLR